MLDLLTYSRAERKSSHLHMKENMQAVTSAGFIRGSMMRVKIPA